jgi:hypothetical protein
VIPFLNQHQDIPSWDRAVHSNSNDICGNGTLLTDRCDSVDNSNQPYRGMHALILAHLAGNSHYEEIVNRAIFATVQASDPAIFSRLRLLNPFLWPRRFAMFCFG